MDLYEVEIISSDMEDAGELIEEREERRESPGNEEEANDDPVSIELVELKARALRCKQISYFAAAAACSHQLTRLSEQLALLSSSTVGLLERSSSQEEIGEEAGLVGSHRASESPPPVGESELSSPESSVVETEKIPGLSQSF